MVREIYYKISAFFYRLAITDLAKNVQLHLKGRVIHGDYVHISENVVLGENWLIAVYPEYGGEVNPVKRYNHGVFIESGVTANRNLTIYCAGSVKIGADSMLGSNVLITDNDHGMNAECCTYSGQPLIVKDTIIEEGCWIAQNCSILAGSHIGKHSIIGAGSLVKGKIPSYCIAVGSPAKVIKRWDFEAHEWRKINE